MALNLCVNKRRDSTTGAGQRASADIGNLSQHLAQDAGPDHQLRQNNQQQLQSLLAAAAVAASAAQQQQQQEQQQQVKSTIGE